MKTIHRNARLWQTLHQQISSSQQDRVINQKGKKGLERALPVVGTGLHSKIHLVTRGWTLPGHSFSSSARESSELTEKVDGINCIKGNNVVQGWVMGY